MMNKYVLKVMVSLSLITMLVGCGAQKEVDNKEAVARSKKEINKNNNNSDGKKDNNNQKGNSIDNLNEVSDMVEVKEGGYSFAIQADSHLDQNTSSDLYNKTIENIVKASPDFLIDLGDTSMVEKLSTTEVEVKERFDLIKGYFDKLGDIQLYLVNGNHDGEDGWDSGKDKKDISDIARSYRLQYFPPITKDEKFSGNVNTANYYSFVKGDIQFIMLDPFTYTTSKGKEDSDGWNYTLGEEQYKWLTNTLENSTSKFKFVFIHNLVGGYTKDSRGGAEAAKFFEWGGLNSDGTDGFTENRPGLEMPIHKLLVKYNVSTVFHGHDHFFANQSLDGIIYQLVPQPGTPGNSVGDAEKYSYKEGVFLPSAGYLRVVVNGDNAAVEYIRASLNDDLNGDVVYSFNVVAK